MIVQSNTTHSFNGTRPIPSYGNGNANLGALVAYRKRCPCLLSHPHADTRGGAGVAGLGLALPTMPDLTQTVTIPGLNVDVSYQTLLIVAAGVAAVAIIGGRFGKKARRRRLIMARLRYDEDRAKALRS